MAQAQSQLQGLNRLEHRLAHAGSATLASLRAEITAASAASQLFASLTANLAQGARAQEMALHAASTAARQTAHGFLEDYYEKKIFDPYLRFDSEEEEAAYRKREAERREAIEKALAEGTPEGNRRALKLSKEQLLDAGAHGADRSPDYAPRLAALTEKEAALAEQLPAARQPEAGRDADPLAALAAAGVTLAGSDAVGPGHFAERTTNPNGPVRG